LKKANSSSDYDTFLLFDGLDTGFGSDNFGRRLRDEAIAGLFSFWMENEALLNHLKFKILLREDIWRKLRFENKSHLFGRSVTLTWKEQAPFFKVVLKQALRTPDLRALVECLWRGIDLDKDRLELWGDDEVFAIWNLLVGERMKGGKTAFTRNWVWNRLADGNDDHSPRYLLQLFHTATEWEKREQEKSLYDKSLIRPRGLTKSLPDVSQQALDALREEFADELQPLLEKLRSLSRTPILAADVRDVSKAVELGREVGLLAIYEGATESVERYKVPEIYRLTLGMTRKGQM
jgi:hypothetical protein